MRWQVEAAWPARVSGAWSTSAGFGQMRCRHHGASVVAGAPQADPVPTVAVERPEEEGSRRGWIGIHRGEHDRERWSDGRLGHVDCHPVGARADPPVPRNAAGVALNATRCDR
jgi:hypothetical protein